jgi:hypothetical protein
MAKTTPVTINNGSNGTIARDTNAHRVWYGAGDIKQVAVTGTWALETNSNVVSLGTDDASSTNVFGIDLPAKYSDNAIQDGSTTDRGIEVQALDLRYQVATSALGAIAFALYKVTFDAEGTPTATAITTTTTFDTDGDDGTEVDVHLATVSIAEGNRFFVDSNAIVYATAAITDGTSSDVNLFGGNWYIRTVAD